MMFLKKSKRGKHDMQLMKIISDNDVPYTECLWKCKGSCYKPQTPDDSVSKHTRFDFPSGMIMFICEVCGAAQIYDDSVDLDIALHNKDNPIASKEKYREFQNKIRKATQQRRDAVKRYESKGE